MAINNVVSGGPVEIKTDQTQFLGPEVLISNATGKVGFFGAEPVVQPTSASVTDFDTLKAALQALGIIGS